MDKLKNCWTSAVLWTLFSPSGAGVHKTADLSSFMDTFPTVSIELLRSAVLWTLSRHPHRTADLSSFMDTFVHNGEVFIELRTSAVLWEYFKTADLSSSMDTFLSSLALWTDIVKSV